MHCSDASREKRPQATGHEPVLWKKRRRDKNIKGNRPVFYLLFVPCEGGSHPFICPSSQSQHRNSLPAGITLTLFATPCRRAAVAGLLIETDRTTIGQLGTRFGGHLPAAVWGPIPIPMHLAFRGFGRDRASCWVLYCASLSPFLSLPAPYSCSALGFIDRFWFPRPDFCGFVPGKRQLGRFFGNTAYPFHVASLGG